MAAVSLLVLTGPARAQPPPAASVVKARDAAVYVGLFDVTRRREDPYVYDTRFGTVLGTLGAGYYWTDHVKTEIEVGLTSEGDTRGSRPVDVAGVPAGFRLYTRNATTTRLVSLAQNFQFFHNQWFHPFVSAGVDLAWERTRVEIPEQRYYPPPIYGPVGTPPQSQPPVLVPARPTEVNRRLIARPFGGTGFKAYVTHHGFFRADMRIGSGGRTWTGVYRVGFGVDF